MEMREYSPAVNHVINSPFIDIMAPVPSPILYAQNSDIIKHINVMTIHLLYLLLSRKKPNKLNIKIRLNHKDMYSNILAI